MARSGTQSSRAQVLVFSPRERTRPVDTVRRIPARACTDTASDGHQATQPISEVGSSWRREARLTGSGLVLGKNLGCAGRGWAGRQRECRSSALDTVGKWAAVRRPRKPTGCSGGRMAARWCQPIPPTAPARFDPSEPGCASRARCQFVGIVDNLTSRPVAGPAGIGPPPWGRFEVPGLASPSFGPMLLCLQPEGWRVARPDFSD